MTILQPMLNTTINQLGDSMGYCGNTSNPMQQYIDQYNAKYAGKRQADVDRQEENAKQLLAGGYVTPDELKRHILDLNQQAKVVESGDIPQEIVRMRLIDNVEDATVIPDTTTTHLTIPKEYNFKTIHNLYCGIHNTVTEGGCEECKNGPNK